jgi:ubiquinone/menaquinone biosynthesis C-methylase UbiE
MAIEYDSPENVASCWGRVTRHSIGVLAIPETSETVVDVGCGTGRELVQIASLTSPTVQFIGVEPAANMRKVAIARTDQLANVRILSGSFESLPLEDDSVDYLYSILAFHWTTDLDKSVAELGRVMAPTGDMDLTFIGRHNGREFIQKTTPIFFKYMSPAAMMKAASLRKQLTLDETTALFRNAFSAPALSVEESYHTYHDTLEGHWSWWVRVEGQLLDIPPGKKEECDQAVRAALSTLATDAGIPYTVHLIHLRLRQS